MNVVMIAIDGLRADRVGCYGHRRPTTPYIDTLAARGVRFENHFTPATPGQPAFTTLFSGAHPLTTRILADEGANQPNPNITWLPLLLRFHRMTTVAVDSLVDQRPWFARGFEYYINPRRRSEHVDCHAYNERAFEWLSRCRREPFFMSLHYTDPRAPFLPKGEHLRSFYRGDPTSRGESNAGLDAFYRSPQATRWNQWLPQLLQSYGGQHAGRRVEDPAFLDAACDASIRTADDGVRELCQTLENLNLLDDTLLIVHGSHGQELLGEHGIYLDAHGLYDATLRVPLILHWPRCLGVDARQVSAMSQHQDLSATVLDAMNLPVPEDVIEGRSLMPLATGETSVSHWHHTLMACESTWGSKWAMRTPEYKLIVSREPDLRSSPAVELYDLLEDPGERHNIAEAQPPLTRTMLDRFDARLAQMLSQRNLPRDPIAAGGATLTRRFLQQQGRPYPIPAPGWRAHASPRPKPPTATAAR